jgi:DNA-binding NtrC family response regulator
VNPGAPAPIIGVSPAIKQATLLMERFAPTTLPILLIGATGTGKELFARHIHVRSGRRGALVDVNCGSLPGEIADSLLFGHRRGAFTGAVETVSGHLERADAGTLFLDEVMDLSLAAQVKLLRALELGEVQPLGAAHKHRVDLRIVAAAQEDTSERIESGTFRQDLFQRLAGVVIELPVLAERPEDIVPLAEHFASAGGQRLEPGSARVLEEHLWPGNVRELRLAIERAGWLVANGTLPAGAIRDAIELGIPRRRVAERRQINERRHHYPGRTWEELMLVCQQNRGDPERVAAALGLRRSAMYEQLRTAGISLRAVRESGSPPDVRRNSAVVPE